MQCKRIKVTVALVRLKRILGLFFKVLVYFVVSVIIADRRYVDRQTFILHYICLTIITKSFKISFIIDVIYLYIVILNGRNIFYISYFGCVVTLRFNFNFAVIYFVNLFYK